MYEFNPFLLCFFQCGLYIFQLLDWYIAAFSLPVFALLECIVFGWIYGIKQVVACIHFYLIYRCEKFYQISYKYMGFEIKIFYLTGADNLSRDIEMMLGRGVPVYMRIMWCIVTPVILTVRAFREK